MSRQSEPGGGRVRVMVWMLAMADDPGAVERAYHAVSPKLAGIPGLLSNQLLRDPADPARYVVASEWASMVDFAAWEERADHRAITAHLRPYQDPQRRPAIYVEVASYGSADIVERPATPTTAMWRPETEARTVAGRT